MRPPYLPESGDSPPAYSRLVRLGSQVVLERAQNADEFADVAKVSGSLDAPQRNPTTSQRVESSGFANGFGAEQVFKDVVDVEGWADAACQGFQRGAPSAQRQIARFALLVDVVWTGVPQRHDVRRLWHLSNGFERRRICPRMTARRGFCKRSGYRLGRKTAAGHDLRESLNRLASESVERMDFRIGSTGADTGPVDYYLEGENLEAEYSAGVLQSKYQRGINTDELVAAFTKYQGHSLPSIFHQDPQFSVMDLSAHDGSNQQSNGSVHSAV